MCGRLNVSDSPGVRALCEQLEIALWPKEGMRFNRFVRATEPVSIVFEQDGKRVMKNAVWWLLLEKAASPAGTYFKPSRFTSFNTRSDKLNVKRSVGYAAFRSGRCVIPAAGFGETLGTGAKARYHDLAVDETDMLAMGGLYRTWRGEDQQGRAYTLYSCSVVTLPPHDSLRAIHDKASPLMLSASDGSLQTWLDSSITDTEILAPLLTPTIRHDFTVTPIDKPSTYQATGPSFSIEQD